MARGFFVAALAVAHNALPEAGRWTDGFDRANGTGEPTHVRRSDERSARDCFKVRLPSYAGLIFTL